MKNMFRAIAARRCGQALRSAFPPIIPAELAYQVIPSKGHDEVGKVEHKPPRELR